MTTNSKCPLSLAQVFQAEFTPMTESDLEGFAGVEGDGYMAEIGEYLPDLDYSYMAVLDYSPNKTVLQVLGPDGECWHWVLPSMPERIS